MGQTCDKCCVALGCCKARILDHYTRKLDRDVERKSWKENELQSELERKKALMLHYAMTGKSARLPVLARECKVIHQELVALGRIQSRLTHGISGMRTHRVMVDSAQSVKMVNLGTQILVKQAGSAAAIQRQAQEVKQSVTYMESFGDVVELGLEEAAPEPKEEEGLNEEEDFEAQLIRDIQQKAAAIQSGPPREQMKRTRQTPTSDHEAQLAAAVARLPVAYPPLS